MILQHRTLLLLFIALLTLLTSCTWQVDPELLTQREATRVAMIQDPTATTPSVPVCVVPNVIGLDRSAAEGLILGTGLLPVRIAQYDDTAASGLVIFQGLEQGTRLSPCIGEVEIVISLGAQPVPTATPFPLTSTPRETPESTIVATVQPTPTRFVASDEVAYREAVALIFEGYIEEISFLYDQYEAFKEILANKDKTGNTEETANEWGRLTLESVLEINHLSAQVRVLVPPARYVSVHADLVYMADLYDAAVTLLLEGMGKTDATQMTLATTVMARGSRALEEAYEKFITLKNSQDVRLGSTVTARSIDYNNVPLDITDTFSATEDTIYVVIEADFIEEGATFFARWSLDGQPFEDSSKITADQDYYDTYIEFHLKNLENNFEEGSYSVELFVNGISTKSVDFTVK